MTNFDEFTFEQRAFAIQQVQTLLETLKEVNFRDRLVEMGLLKVTGDQTIEAVEDELLHAVSAFFSPMDADQASEE